MKKLSLFIVLLLTIFITGCGSNKLTSLSLDGLREMLDKKESFIIYFGSEKNTDLENKLNTVLERNDLEGYRMDINKLSDEEKIKLQKDIPFEDSSIVFIIEGRDPSKLSHVTDKDILIKHLENRLRNLKFIK